MSANPGTSGPSASPGGTLPRNSSTHQHDEDMREVDAFLDDEERDGSGTGVLSQETAGNSTLGFEPSPSRSPYHLPTSERLRGVANRILFSRYYIIFYLAMTGLSLGTVILSLLEGGCPSTTWHILEIIVNGGMVLEVGTRWVGFGKQYPMTPLNILDLFLTFFCVLTLLLVFLNPCGAGSKREEVLDTILLVVRNFVQFWRLGTILRRSGHSLLHPPRPIDLSQAQAAAFDLELGMEDEEFGGAGAGTQQVRSNSNKNGGYEELPTDSEAVFDAGEELDEQPPRQAVIGSGKGQTGYQAGRENLTSQDEDQWDRMG